MNDHTSAHSPNTRFRDAFSMRALTALILALALVTLAFAVPAFAGTPIQSVEQGTVPLPPPTDPATQPGDRNDDTDDPPTATSTPAPVGEAVAQINPAAATPAAYIGVVLSPRLNVRSGPGTTFGSLGQHLQDQAVTIQFRDNTGDWWYTCCISGTTTGGWSSASFIRTDFSTADGLSFLPLYPELSALPVSNPVAAAPAQTTPLATPRPANGDLTAIVDAQPRLIVRDAAGTNGAILGRISDGATIEVIARNEAGDWWYVCCVDGSDTEGWANAAFLVPNFNAANAVTLIPLFGSQSLQLPTPTPRASVAAPGLPVITKMPKILSIPRTTPTPVTVVVPAAATETVASTPAPTSTPAPATTALPEEEATPLSSLPTTLVAVAWQEPAFAAPGDTVLLRYLITNTGAETAREVAVRNELPSGFLLAQGAGTPTAQFDRQSLDSGSTVFSFLWDALPAGESVSATVAVTLAPTLAPGSVIHNLAAVGALNAAAQTATITISTPPTSLPTFQ